MCWIKREEKIMTHEIHSHISPSIMIKVYTFPQATPHDLLKNYTLADK